MELKDLTPDDQSLLEAEFTHREGIRRSQGQMPGGEEQRHAAFIERILKKGPQELDDYLASIRNSGRTAGVGCG